MEKNLQTTLAAYDGFRESMPSGHDGYWASFQACRIPILLHHVHVRNSYTNIYLHPLVGGKHKSRHVNPKCRQAYMYVYVRPLIRRFYELPGPSTLMVIDDFMPVCLLDWPLC